jgi:acyl carrier protein
MQEIFLQLFKEILDIEDREIQMTNEFRSYDEWDSIANLSVIAMIDDEYDIVIENSEFKKIKTIQGLWDEIEKRK